MQGCTASFAQLYTFSKTRNHHTRPHRYCLATLKQGNPRNASDILAAVRSSPALGRDFGRLRDALELLRPEGDDAGGNYSIARAAAAREERALLARIADEEAEEEARWVG